MAEFKDGMKLGEKPHLITRPTHAVVDPNLGIIRISDQGRDYKSFPEMNGLRKEVSSDLMYNGINSGTGYRFASRGVSVVGIMEIDGSEYIVSSCRRGKNVLSPINGFYGNGLKSIPEGAGIPENIGVTDGILRTGGVEIGEEYLPIRQGRVIRCLIQVTKDSIPFSFTPYSNSFIYTEDCGYKFEPLEKSLDCLVNLHEFPPAKVSDEYDDNPRRLGDNVGITFDRFNNCFQIFISGRFTFPNGFDRLLQTEDKFRDADGLDTNLYIDGIKLIQLGVNREMTGEVYQYNDERGLRRINEKELKVSDGFTPKDPDTQLIITDDMTFLEMIEYVKGN